MAAADTFRMFNAHLAEPDRRRLQHVMQSTAAELLAARSEDARKRIVESYLDEVRMVTHKST